MDPNTIQKTEELNEEDFHKIKEFDKEQKFRKKEEFRKILENFKTAKESIDLLPHLKKLRTEINNLPCMPNLESYMPLHLFFKRMNQCLNPLLTASLHNEVLSIFKVLLRKYDIESKKEALGIIRGLIGDKKEVFLSYECYLTCTLFKKVLPGLFSFFINSTINTNEKYLTLIEDELLNVALNIDDFVRNIIIGVLPSFNEGTDLKKRGSKIIATLYSKIERKQNFWIHIFDLFINCPNHRLSVLVFLKENLSQILPLNSLNDHPKNSNEKAYGLFFLNIIHEPVMAIFLIKGLEDVDIAVAKETIDMFSKYFETKNFKKCNQEKLFAAAYMNLIRRDANLNSRVYSMIEHVETIEISVYLNYSKELLKSDKVSNHNIDVLLSGISKIVIENKSKQLHVKLVRILDMLGITCDQCEYLFDFILQKIINPLLNAMKGIEDDSNYANLVNLFVLKLQAFSSKEGYYRSMYLHILKEFNKLKITRKKIQVLDVKEVSNKDEQPSSEPENPTESNILALLNEQLNQSYLNEKTQNIEFKVNNEIDSLLVEEELNIQKTFDLLIFLNNSGELYNDLEGDAHLIAILFIVIHNSDTKCFYLKIKTIGKLLSYIRNFDPYYKNDMLVDLNHVTDYYLKREFEDIMNFGRIICDNIVLYIENNFDYLENFLYAHSLLHEIAYNFQTFVISKKLFTKYFQCFGKFCKTYIDLDLTELENHRLYNILFSCNIFICKNIQNIENGTLSSEIEIYFRLLFKKKFFDLLCVFNTHVNNVLEHYIYDLLKDSKNSSNVFELILFSINSDSSGVFLGSLLVFINLKNSIKNDPALYVQYKNIFKLFILQIKKFDVLFDYFFEILLKCLKKEIKERTINEFYTVWSALNFFNDMFAISVEFKNYLKFSNEEKTCEISPHNDTLIEPRCNAFYKVIMSILIQDFSLEIKEMANQIICYLIDLEITNVSYITSNYLADFFAKLHANSQLFRESSTSKVLSLYLNSGKGTKSYDSIINLLQNICLESMDHISILYLIFDIHDIALKSAMIMLHLKKTKNIYFVSCIIKHLILYRQTDTIQGFEYLPLSIIDKLVELKKDIIKKENIYKLEGLQIQIEENNNLIKEKFNDINVLGYDYKVEKDIFIEIVEYLNKFHLKKIVKIMYEKQFGFEIFETKEHQSTLYVQILNINNYTVFSTLYSFDKTMDSKMKDILFNKNIKTINCILYSIKDKDESLNSCLWIMKKCSYLLIEHPSLKSIQEDAHSFLRVSFDHLKNVFQRSIYLNSKKNLEPEERKEFIESLIAEFPNFIIFLKKNPNLIKAANLRTFVHLFFDLTTKTKDPIIKTKALITLVNISKDNDLKDIWRKMFESYLEIPNYFEDTLENLKLKTRIMKSFVLIDNQKMEFYFSKLEKRFFSSRSTEITIKTEVLKKIAYLLFTSPIDHHLRHVARILQLITENIQEKDENVRACCFFMARYVCIRFSENKLHLFWTNILSEILLVFERIVDDENNFDQFSDVYMEVFKLFDIFLNSMNYNTVESRWSFISPIRLSENANQEANQLMIKDFENKDTMVFITEENEKRQYLFTLFEKLKNACSSPQVFNDEGLNTSNKLHMMYLDSLNIRKIDKIVSFLNKRNYFMIRKVFLDYTYDEPTYDQDFLNDFLDNKKY